MPNLIQHNMRKPEEVYVEYRIRKCDEVRVVSLLWLIIVFISKVYLYSIILVVDKQYWIFYFIVRLCLPHPKPLCTLKTVNDAVVLVEDSVGEAVLLVENLKGP